MINQVTIVGRLGADPEIRYTAQGSMVANLRVATDEQWKDKNGDKQSKTEWHRIVFFGKLAEIVGEYLKKGRLVFIQGRLQTRSWDKEGVTMYTTEIIGGQMKMLDKGNGNGNSAPQPDIPPMSDEDVPF